MVQVQYSRLGSGQVGERVGTGTKDKCRSALTTGGYKGNGKDGYKAA